jgi:hypothetical protein
VELPKGSDGQHNDGLDVAEVSGDRQADYEAIASMASLKVGDEMGHSHASYSGRIESAGAGGAGQVGPWRQWCESLALAQLPLLTSRAACE